MKRLLLTMALLFTVQLHAFGQDTLWSYHPVSLPAITMDKAEARAVVDGLKDGSRFPFFTNLDQVELDDTKLRFQPIKLRRAALILRKAKRPDWAQALDRALGRPDGLFGVKQDAPANGMAYCLLKDISAIEVFEARPVDESASSTQPMGKNPVPIPTPTPEPGQTYLLIRVQGQGPMVIATDQPGEAARLGLALRILLGKPLQSPLAATKGLQLDEDGVVVGLTEGGPAQAAGLALGDKVWAIQAPNPSGKVGDKASDPKEALATLIASRDPQELVIVGAKQGYKTVKVVTEEPYDTFVGRVRETHISRKELEFTLLTIP